MFEMMYFKVRNKVYYQVKHWKLDFGFSGINEFWFNQLWHFGDSAPNLAALIYIKKYKLQIE